MVKVKLGPDSKEPANLRNVMIERLQRIATILHRFRALITFLGITSLGVFSLSMFNNPWIDGNVWLIPSLLLLCWSLALFTLLSLFQRIPDKVDKTSPWRKRLSNSFRRGAYGLAGAAFVALSSALLMLTYQLLRAWSMG